MKVVLIGHPEAVQGFALVGVHGKSATSVEEINQALDESLAAEDIGIILVTDDVASMIKERMDQLKLRSTIPLVVEIPGPDGPAPNRPSLEAIIQRAIGIKI